MTDYFSDREQGPRARTEETISPATWGGIVALVQSLIDTGAFGAKFPEVCLDGHAPVGTDSEALSRAVKAELPGLGWPLETTIQNVRDYSLVLDDFAPDTLLILDFVEFCHRLVAKPILGSYHEYFQHHHLHFDQDEGRNSFRIDINRMFSRNNLAYELNEEGEVVRLASPFLGESLSSAQFDTGDSTLDEMLADSRAKFLNPDPTVRREALERLWDCWERLKSLELPQDKKRSIKSLLEKAAHDPAFFDLLDTEAHALTDIGNSFHIRHTEVTQSRVEDSSHVDYLFHRLFCLIDLILSKRGTVT